MMTPYGQWTNLGVKMSKAQKVEQRQCSNHLIGLPNLTFSPQIQEGNF